MDPTPEAPPRARGPAAANRRLLAFAGVAVLIVGAFVAIALNRESKPWKRSGPPATVTGWAPYWQPEAAYASFSANINDFSDVSWFAYHATAVDQVAAYDSVDPNATKLFAATARGAGVPFIASIIDDTPAGTMAAILADPAQRSLHVKTIVDFVGDNDVDGVDLDYEKFAFSDGRATWETTRPNWVAFLTELADALHAKGKTLTVSVPPVYDGKHTSDSGYWVYDYAAMGKVVDSIRIMAYDYSTSAPGPIAPIDWVRSVVKAAKDLVPDDKLVLGVPVYGYDWPTGVSGVCPAGQEPKRTNVSTKTAPVLAASHNVIPTWAAAVAERTFDYTEQLTGNDANGKPTTCTVDHTVWYADAQAVHDRAWLAERENLAGISLWSLGSDDPQVWEGIDAARANVETWPTVVSTLPSDAGATTTAGGTTGSPVQQPSP